MPNFCDCSTDGFCLRYQREMRGRMREICAGVNVDLGTSAAFRSQWARETHNVGLPGPQGPPGYVPIPLLLKTGQAPGDALVMTAAIYSLHRAYPGKYITAVESYWPDVFLHNPDVSVHLMPSSNTPLSGVHEVQMHYPAIHESNERGIHFMQGFCEFLGSALGVSVPLLTNRPYLYFASPKPSVHDYWIVCSGGKLDFTNKLWGYHNYQAVVSMLHGRVKFVQVGGSRPPVPWAATTLGSQEDDHPKLQGVEDMVGKTSLRDLFDLVRQAKGVLCGVSLLMHVAAALEKPCIVIAGGREPVAWNAYSKQHYLHTVGMLPCRDNTGKIGGACWRARVTPLEDGTPLDQNTCEYPVGNLPKCMTMITPEEVASLILRYN